MNYWRRSVKIITLLLACLTTIVIVTYGQPSKATLSTEDIDAIASQTTILIAEQLKKGDVEAVREYDPGSGVIVAKKGNTYYALTNNHVVKTLKPGVKWGVRTWDGKVHRITDGQDIIRFGEFQDQSTPIKGLDLALLKFSSRKNYRVVDIGNPENLKAGDQVFISGWPRPLDNSSVRKRVLIEGNIAKVANNPDINDGGYGLLYSNQTRPGMSGAPIFNSQGELVGIGGRGRRHSNQSNQYCIDPELNINNNCGIKINDFVNQVKVQQLNLNLKIKS